MLSRAKIPTKKYYSTSNDKYIFSVFWLKLNKPIYIIQQQFPKTQTIYA